MLTDSKPLAIVIAVALVIGAGTRALGWGLGALASGNVTAGPDVLPDPFAFADVTDADRSTVYATSNVTLAGFSGNLSITVAGGNYSINGGGWTAAAGNVTAGDAIRAQVESSADWNTAVDCLVQVGTSNDTFTVTTIAQDTTPDAWAFTDVVQQARSSTAESGNVTITGVTGDVPISVTGGNYSIDGGGWTSAAGNVTNGQQIQAQVATSADYKTTTSATVTVGTSSDTYSATTEEDCVLLLHCDGADGGTTFTDQPGIGADSPHSVTAYVNAQTDTQNKFGGASLQLDGASYIKAADSADWTFGTGNLTIEFWLRKTGVADNKVILFVGDETYAGAFNRMQFTNVSANIQFLVTEAGATVINLLSASDPLVANTWQHIAVIRNGDDWTLTVDGASVATATYALNFPDTASGVMIGAEWSLASFTTGWLDEVRISNVARWTSFPFAPPSAAY